MKTRMLAVLIPVDMLLTPLSIIDDDQVQIQSCRTGRQVPEEDVKKS